MAPVPSVAGGGSALAAANCVPFVNSGVLTAAHVTAHASGNASGSAQADLPTTYGSDHPPGDGDDHPQESTTTMGGAPTTSSATADPAGSADAQAAGAIVSALGADCPSLLSTVPGVTKELDAVPTSQATVFQVTATAHDDALGDAKTTWLVDTRTRTATDAASRAALSACSIVTGVVGSANGSASVSLTVSG